MMRARGYRNGVGVDLTLSAIDDAEHLLDEQAALAFARMASAAKRVGITLEVNSAFRSHERQQELWDEWVAEQKKWEAALPAIRGTRPLRPSRPGWSKHESGLAVDLDCYHDNGRAKPALAWLRQHASQYGFHNTVPKEPWHYEFQELIL